MVQPCSCHERTLFQKSPTPGALTISSLSRLSGITAISGLMFNPNKSRSRRRQTRQFIVGQISSNRRMNRVRIGALVRSSARNESESLEQADERLAERQYR